MSRMEPTIADFEDLIERDLQLRSKCVKFCIFAAVGAICFAVLGFFATNMIASLVIWSCVIAEFFLAANFLSIVERCENRIKQLREICEEMKEEDCTDG